MKYLLIYMCLLFAGNSFSQDWREELKLARSLYKEQNYKKAYNQYLKVDSLKPKEIDIKPEIAQSAYKSGLYNVANKLYKKISKSKKYSSTEINYNLGNSYYKSEDYKKAIEAYKKALRKNPSNEKARYNLTLALKNQPPPKQKNQPKDNQNKKNPPKPKPNPKNNDKKQEDNQPQPDQSMQKDRTERMLDELMKNEMKTKQNLEKGSGKNKSNNNGKDW